MRTTTIPISGLITLMPLSTANGFQTLRFISNEESGKLEMIWDNVEEELTNHLDSESTLSVRYFLRDIRFWNSFSPSLFLL